jgi:hypothetical protein
MGLASVRRKDVLRYKTFRGHGIELMICNDAGNI